MSDLNKERLMFAAMVAIAAIFYFTNRPAPIIMDEEPAPSRVQAMNNWLDAGMQRHGKH